MSSMCKTKFFFIVLAFYYSWSVNLSAEVIIENGEYILSSDISERECFRNAEQKALNNAATNISGEKLKSETMKVCESSFETAQCELYQSSWSVIDSVSRKGPVEILNRAKIDKGIYDLCEVTIKVDLYEMPKSNPNFDFSLNLNQSKFLAGHEWSLEDDPLKITIRPFEQSKMFINIFHWAPYKDGENVNRIFPNPQKETYNGIINLISNETLLPRASAGYSWRHFFPKDHHTDSISEGILVFASQENIIFSDTYSYEKFQEKLLEVSDSNSRTKKTFYVVIEK